jgi:hypothetical protein
MDRLTDVPGFGGHGIVEEAPPECLEDRFCELRLNGVLGSSAKGASAKLGDVLARRGRYAWARFFVFYSVPAKKGAMDKR